VQVIRLTAGSSAALSGQIQNGDYVSRIDGYQVRNYLAEM